MALDLEVWLFADHAGILSLVEGRPNFCYAPDAGRGFAGNGVAQRIIALIEQRCTLTIRRLTNSVPESETVA